MATEIPFVGPSYDLKVKKADVQRSVNLMPTPIESGTGKSGMFLKPVPGLVEFSGPAEPPAGCNFVSIFTDTFTDTNGVPLEDHTPDVTSSNWGWFPGGLTEVFLETQDGGAVVNAASDPDFEFGYADLYSTVDYGETLPLTFPYRVTIVGRHAPEALGLVGTVRFVLQDDTGTDNAFYVRLSDDGSQYKADATMYVDTVPHESSVVLASNAETTLVVTVTETGFTLAVNGTPLTSVECASRSVFTYAQMEISRGDSYMSMVDIEVCE